MNTMCKHTQEATELINDGMDIAALAMDLTDLNLCQLREQEALEEASAEAFADGIVTADEIAHIARHETRLHRLLQVSMPKHGRLLRTSQHANERIEKVIRQKSAMVA
jgi:hypothetical protein